MKKIQLKLDINDHAQIRLALKALSYRNHDVLNRLNGPIVHLSMGDVNFLNKVLENAAESENNWLIAQQYRETYGKVLAQIHGADKQKDDIYRNRIDADQQSETHSSH